MPETHPKTEYVVGVDLGGTKIYAGVFDAALRCVAVSKLTTKAGRGPAAVMDRVARCVADAVDEADLSMKQVRGLGIGAPGTVEADSGKVIFAPNLDWREIPLKKEMEKRLDVPVFVENDCKQIMHGVYDVELKRKPRSAAGVFVGTGIGGALVVNGEMHYGSTRTAGEIGHMVLQVGGPRCGCGSYGCFEALASRTAIFRRIQEAVKNGQKTILTDMLGHKLEDMRSGDLRKAIRKGDKFVDKVVEEAAEYIGIGVANLVNILNPEVVVLGGGVIDALEDEMMSIIVETAKDYAMDGTARGLEIIASKLGDDGGITGGAVVALRSTQ